MAGADYYDCDCCGSGKVFYDANIDWENFNRIGQFRAICSDCYNNGIRIKFMKNDKEMQIDLDQNLYAHSSSAEYKNKKVKNEN